MSTLYLNGFGSSAHLKGKKVEVIRVNLEDDSRQRMYVPFFDIDRVVLIGKADITVPLIHCLSHHGIPVHYLSRAGRWLGTFYPNADGHALRRLRQYAMVGDHAFALRFSRAVVEAKLRNARRVLQRLASNRSMADESEQHRTLEEMKNAIAQVEDAGDLDTLRGIEGLAAARYFNRLAAFFPEDMPFNGRSRRPPRDAANAMLSWTYTICQTEIDGAVRAASLDPCLGFFHQVSYGRPSLSLDLLEPLRPALCDMLALRMLNHRRVRPEHFQFNSEDGGTYLTPEGRQRFFPEYERTMARRFTATARGSHRDFRGIVRDQVNSVLHSLENSDQPDPELFLMP